MCWSTVTIVNPGCAAASKPRSMDQPQGLDAIAHGPERTDRLRMPGAAHCPADQRHNRLEVVPHPMLQLPQHALLLLGAGAQLGQDAQTLDDGGLKVGVTAEELGYRSR